MGKGNYLQYIATYIYEDFNPYKKMFQGKLVLASQSPRRKELLQMLQINFDVVPSLFVEVEKNCAPDVLVCENAFGKANEVAGRFPNELVLGVDTIGFLNGEILEKPKDKNEAFEMVKKLSGSIHDVVSGMCLIKKSENLMIQETVFTKVVMDQLSDEEIWEYVNTGEGLDKAAAYAIQGLGSRYVKAIEGDYFNVVGLPVNSLWKMLKKV